MSFFSYIYCSSIVDIVDVLIYFNCFLCLISFDSKISNKIRFLSFLFFVIIEL